MMDDALSHVGAVVGGASGTEEATVSASAVVALAAAGMPWTICILSFPYAKSETLKQDRSDIWAGAAQDDPIDEFVGEVVVGGTVTVSVAVTGSNTVTVTGAAVIVSMTVMTSITVVGEAVEEDDDVVDGGEGAGGDDGGGEGGGEGSVCVPVLEVVEEGGRVGDAGNKRIVEVSSISTFDVTIAVTNTIAGVVS